MGSRSPSSRKWRRCSAPFRENSSPPPRGDPCILCCHIREQTSHNCGSNKQRLVDPAAAFQQGGEEGSLPQFRDRQIQIPRRRGQHPGAGSVAVGGAVGRPFERAGADERGRFRVDQFLIQCFGRNADAVGDIGEFQLSKQVEQHQQRTAVRVPALFGPQRNSHRDPEGYPAVALIAVGHRVSIMQCAIEPWSAYPPASASAPALLTALNLINQP